MPRCWLSSGDTAHVIVRHRQGLDGAARALGATVVVDVFRAYSAAAYAFAAGAKRILLSAEVEEARRLAAAIPDSLLMGEVDGVRPAGFHLGNSPGEIVAEPHLVAGRTLIHRSSAGTRCALASIGNGARPVYLASLVVASATAAAVANQPEVTIVASGTGGIEHATEDDVCADLLESLLLTGRADTGAAADSVATSERAGFLAASSFAHPDDVRLCSEVDRFEFAMTARVQTGAVVVTPTRDPGS